MATSQCKECGGATRRSRRSVLERIIYVEAFRCDGCGKRTKTAAINLKLVRYVKCPCCHSVDLTILRRPDRIDRMHKGIVNIFHRLVGGKLYHCWFCRVQFYDTRRRFNVIREPGNKVLDSDPESKVELAS